MIIDGLRPLWLPSINDVHGTPLGRLSEWVNTGQYYFDRPVGPTSASFVLQAGSSLLDTFAAEMSRFASAAIESSSITAQVSLPKSTAWLFIRTYYAAFYAAHSILRSVGIAATNFSSTGCQRIDSVANALGFGNAPLNAAQFKCEYSAQSYRLECTKASGKGIHEQFWRIFHSFLRMVSSRVLQNSLLPSADAQEIFAKLDELRSVLEFHGCNGGNWLSTIRNEVTYMQRHHAWFPYGRTRADCNRLFQLQREWRKGPDAIRLRPSRANDLDVFMLACAFLVSLSVAVVNDMASRSTLGTSFLLHGPIKLLNQLTR